MDPHTIPLSYLKSYLKASPSLTPGALALALPPPPFPRPLRQGAPVKDDEGKLKHTLITLKSENVRKTIINL